MKPIFDLFGRILVHNSLIQCFPLRGNQETESCVCMVPGPAVGAEADGTNPSPCLDPPSCTIYCIYSQGVAHP